MNEVQANGGIDNLNARYNTKMEGYTTRMLCMEELYSICPRANESSLARTTDGVRRKIFKTSD